MALAKVDDDGTSLSAQRVKEISKPADDITAVLKERKCKSEQEGKAGEPKDKWLPWTARLDVISWNVAGVTADWLEDFVAHMGCHSQW